MSRRKLQLREGRDRVSGEKCYELPAIKMIFLNPVSGTLAYGLDRSGDLWKFVQAKASVPGSTSVWLKVTKRAKDGTKKPKRR